jgi:hypothetical protein
MANNYENVEWQEYYEDVKKNVSRQISFPPCR